MKASTMKINQIPDDCLTKIFSYLKRYDIENCKLVSRFFYHNITHYSKYLSRPVINQISILGKCSNDDKNIKLGRVRFGRIEKNNKNKYYEVCLSKKSRKSGKIKVLKSIEGENILINNKIIEYMKEYIINESLRFLYVDFDTIMCKSFLEKRIDLSEICNIDFTLSPLYTDPEYFYKLLTRSNCEKLNMEFCRNTEKYLNDKLLTSLPNLSSLQVQLSNNDIPLSITDATLQYWLTKKSGFPLKINLSQCYTKFSLSKILEVASKLYHHTRNVSRQIYLGEINITQYEFLLLSKLPYTIFQLNYIQDEKYYLFLNLDNETRYRNIDFVNQIALRINISSDNPTSHTNDH
uniref:F-box domain-containing protein n=1 Tax=Parastrongyloides trichosuri TaxID=131310 RepID=A0A0N4ZP84_PARTI